MGQQTLLVVLSASVMLSVSVIGFSGLWEYSTGTVCQNAEQTQSLNAATTGVNLALAKLRLDKTWCTGFSNLNVNGGTVTVQIASIGLDTVRITSAGTLNGETHTSIVEAKLSSIFPTVESALTVFGDSVQFNNTGKSFFIDGHDYIPSGKFGAPGPYPAVVGLGVQKQKIADYLKSQITTNGVANLVQGKTTNPSVGLYHDMDLVQLRNFYVNLYTRKLPVGKYTGNATYGTLASPEIVWVPGNLEWNGTIEGAGILIVDGTLIMKGNISWQGIVLALAGNVTFDLGGTGDPHIMGTVLVGNNVSSITKVNVTGNPSIRYSYTVLQTILANLNLLKVQVIRYWE
jgi:hypothetical protein